MHIHAHGEGGHTHSSTNYSARNIWLAIILLLSYAVLEAIAGWWAGSLALLSDAGHMATDVFSLGLAGAAVWYMKKPATQRHSYGMARAEVMAALINGLLNILIVIPIMIEAVERFSTPQPVNGLIVSSIAGLALFVTAGAAFLLNSSEKTLNTRAAMLHLIGDMLGSLAALISGLVIYFTGWTPIDPLLSGFICLLIILSTIQLLRDTFRVLMEGVPLHINLSDVGYDIAACGNVTSVHDLHIWMLSSGVVVLSAHIVIKDMHVWESVLKEIKILLEEKYAINHITLQPETAVEPKIINLIS